MPSEVVGSTRLVASHGGLYLQVLLYNNYCTCMCPSDKIHALCLARNWVTVIGVQEGAVRGRGELSDFIHPKW